MLIMAVGETEVGAPSLTTGVNVDTTDTLCEKLTCTNKLGLRNPAKENPSPERET
jgi:hypothetical protein